MAHTAYLPIIADRYGAVVRHIFVVGLDLTGIEMRAQVRLYGDAPGPPKVDLLTVGNGNAQGLRLVEVTSDAIGIPTSHVELVISETTMEALPYEGEIGDVTTLAWDWQVTIAGRKRRLAKGEFQITGDGVTGAEVAPANRIAPFGLPQRPVADVWSSACMTFGEEQVTVKIDGADLIAPFAKKADDAATRAGLAETQAGLAAGAAQAVSRYFTTRAAGEAASAVDQAFATDDGVGNVIYYKRTSGGSTEIGRAVTPATLQSPDGAQRVGYRGRDVESKLDDGAISVMDFMTKDQVASVRTNQGVVDCTDAFNAAFAEATRRSRTVIVPDGVYLVGNLEFGTQNEAGQSFSPLGLIGQSKVGVILKARPGLTGTLLKSWSVAGITFRDFSIDTTGSSAQAWSAVWKPGPGPSTQNVVENIIATVHNNFRNGTAHVDWGNLNDTYPKNVTVRPGGFTDYSNCYISAVQSGGLTAMEGVIWTGGYMNFGCQNGELLHCWGHGMQFADGCLNHVSITAAYMYANPNRSAVFWSESQAQNSGLKALILIASELNTQMGGIASYFDINLFSTLHLIGCEFIGDAPKLFGAIARGDGIGPALCKIQGGTYYPEMAVADVINGTGIEVEAEGFRNAGTSRMLTKNRARNFQPVIQAQGKPAGTYTTSSSTFGRAHRTGNTVRFKLRIGWISHSSTGIAEISGLPWDIQAGGVDGVAAELISLGSPSTGARAAIADGKIIFYDADNNPIPLPSNGEVILSGHYSAEA